MSLGYELKIEQTQKLSLTPALLAAITVMQMNAVQLEEYVSEQLLSNPMLERDESMPQDGPESPAIDWGAYARDMEFGNSSESGEVSPDEDVLEPASPAGVTLAEYLCTELQFAGLREDVLAVAMFMADCLDDDGYLRVSLQEIAQRTGASDALVKEALLHLQAMEPAGVSARDLAECLTIQLIRKGADCTIAMALIKDHLEDIAANRIASVAKRLKASPSEIQDICDIIKTLDPKPGLLFSKDAQAHYITPDVFVERTEDGFAVSVNEGQCPRLIISPYYRKLLEDPAADEQLKTFLENRYDSAAWLLRSIQQRNQTIASVTGAIASIQEGFLLRGEDLRPMTLQQVAEIAGVHESTVSRCTSGKYVQTPRGLFDLKYFFKSSLAGDSSEGVSSDSAKKQIAEYIAAENGKAPLSDQAIAQLLKEEKGISISRRTVAKYREAMGIPSSSGRKRF